MGNREQYLQEGIRLLNRTPDVRITRKSSVYETDPFGFTDQDPFLNMAVEVQTGLSALELLHRMLEIELKLGRKREVRWGPRTLDLDLLSYNRQIWTSPELILPHPGVKERAFVLIPLQEIAPDDAIPGIPSLAQHGLSLQGKEGVRKWTTTSSPNESGLSGS
ncbi:2-amino-4-hydroxy-6-hydroxymethyldihydropteridine diphosphokinase [Paenibacillus aurantius]|uniref:2-amino-4-hydroxy-6-hydroxymethyldihydropteridine diphosphokinase n=1 Tax=Paenibacillus aurantius TaxID=2918900 RepID=A0AA96LJF7_9BACL|nr:2-amino-4-hydroxy-6-hydroxymethyldihydropteridine diphosphokinase [Paenibacillus aurantius]WNQ14133.1 2-amino-4-hydroxy-6-hydroxymethyldihydropteridine diphosphokinase [Paenibacillus aurantius]